MKNEQVISMQLKIRIILKTCHLTLKKKRKIKYLKSREKQQLAKCVQVQWIEPSHSLAYRNNGHSKT